MGMRWYGSRVPAAALDTLRDPAVWDDEDADPVDDVAVGDSVDIDKAWHGIHRLLAGTAWEATPGAGSAILGGEVLVDEDFTVYAHGPDDVRAVAAALDALDLDEVATRFDAVAFETDQIYPDIWVRDGREALDYLLGYLPAVVDLYRAASAHGDAVVATVC